MWVDVEQNTPEWFQLRAGRFGGSSIGTIMANYGKAFGTPAHKLAVKIALEQLRGEPIESLYSNAHMERGHEQEPIARQLYEIEYFCDVTNGGYFIGDGYTGVSPDGLVGKNGSVEIKSVIASVQFDTVKRGKHDPAYKWQLPFDLKVSRREWIDYISFCSEFPKGKRLFVERLYADDLKDKFEMIDKRVAEFTALINEKKKVIDEYNS